MADDIKKTVELKAPVERVWRALTDHDEFGEWFRVRVEKPFIPGELSDGHITYPGFEHVKWAVRVRRMEAPWVFSFAWHPYAVDPAIDYSRETPTLVEFRLEPIPTGTRLTIVESGFDAVPAERREEAWRMNESGWTEQMENIRAYVEV